MAAVITEALRHGVHYGRGHILCQIEPAPAARLWRCQLFQRGVPHAIREVMSTADGIATFAWVALHDDGYYVIASDTSPFPLASTIVDRITPTLEGAPAWALPVLAGQVISGQALGQSGQPANLISFRDWETKRVRYNLVPESDGTWSVTLPNGQWDITYFVDGCAPVCHGPYLITGG